MNVECVLCLNCTTFDTALAWVFSNTPAKCDIDWDEWFVRHAKDIHTDRQAEIPGFMLHVNPPTLQKDLLNTIANIRHIPLGKEAATDYMYEKIFVFVLFQSYGAACW